MTIEGFLARMCTQTAVYWGNPQDNGEGGYTFDGAAEIACRWEDRTEVVETIDGRQLVADAIVYVLQDLDEEGYLYLGDLDDLDSDPHPNDVTGAWQIKRFQKTPALRATNDFMRRAYLVSRR